MTLDVPFYSWLFYVVQSEREGGRREVSVFVVVVVEAQRRGRILKRICKCLLLWRSKGEEGLEEGFQVFIVV